MANQCTATFESKVDSVAWESGLVPCTYLVCELDQGVYFWLQQKMLDGVSKESGQPWKIEKVHSGHSPWLTQIPAILRLVKAAADDVSN